MSNRFRNINRWRLILGKFSKNQLDINLNKQEMRLDNALEYLYGREYLERGVRTEKKSGSLDPSQLTLVNWLSEVRELFPKTTLEVIESHALERYDMTGLVTDPEILEKLEPNFDLLKTVLALKDKMKPHVIESVKNIVRKVSREIEEKLKTETESVLQGKINRFKRSHIKVSQNLDWKNTLRQNLKNYDPANQQLLLENVYFHSRSKRFLPWRVVLCVDQSGSMAESVIHSAVMAGVFNRLPLLDVKLVLFDTQFVDMSEKLDDMVELLLGLQLGGGTDIGRALRYCEQLIDNPSRTILILISDFAEGGSPNSLITTTRRIAASGTKCLGLASLDMNAESYYDKDMASQLAAAGMEIGAMTPCKLAEWMAQWLT
jgi:Mg-chelatase subunit ChlD